MTTTRVSETDRLEALEMAHNLESYVLANHSPDAHVMMKHKSVAHVADLLKRFALYHCDVVSDVAAFHAKFGLTYDGPPRVLDDALGEFRKKFLQEELAEYKEAMYMASYNVQFRPEKITENLASMLDALVDLVYVAVGTAEYHGFPFAEAWRRVQTANMAKERAASAADSKRGHAFDVVKPKGWIAPDHTDLVENHAHKGVTK